MPTLCKQERLYEFKLIELLFSKGATLFAGGKPAPLKVRWLLIEPDPQYPRNTAFPCKIMVSASKRHFKHAVTRNRLKRLLREAYRAHKAGFEAVVPFEADGVRTRTLLLSLQYQGAPDIKLQDIEPVVAEVASKVERALARSK